MGQSCCGRTAKYGAFKSDLGAPLMSDLAKKLPPSTKVIIVRLVNLQDIPIGNSFAGTSDAYCEISCSPNDPVVGVQKQTSAVKPGTLNPVWVLLCYQSWFLALFSFDLTHRLHLNDINSCSQNLKTFEFSFQCTLDAITYTI